MKKNEEKENYFLYVCTFFVPFIVPGKLLGCNITGVFTEAIDFLPAPK